MKPSTVLPNPHPGLSVIRAPYMACGGPDGMWAPSDYG
jgi:hypothetical protein